MHIFLLIILGITIPVMGSCTSKKCPPKFKLHNNDNDSYTCVRTITSEEFEKSWKGKVSLCLARPVSRIVEIPCYSIVYNSYDKEYSGCYTKCNSQ